MSSAGPRKSSYNQLPPFADSPLEEQPLDYDPKNKELTMWRRHGIKLLALTVLGASLLAFARHTAASAPSPGPPQELYSCINDGFDQQLTTYRDFAYQKPAR